MTTEMNFNVKGKTHSLRLLPRETVDGSTLWEALVDGTEYLHFEVQGTPEIWELFNLAVNAYVDYLRDDEVVKIRWRD